MNLILDSIALSFGDAAILRGISGELQAGNVVSLVGPNGAGKTTLANIITGFAVPTSGQIRLDGIVLTGKSPEAIAQLGIARTFQEQHISWNATCLENVLSALDFKIPDKHLLSKNAGVANRQERALELLDSLEIGDLAHMPARDLSFGQQRLVSLARIFAASPHLLLLDEPFTGLKSQARYAVLAHIKKATATGRIVLAIDHDLSTLGKMGGRIWFLNRGRLHEYASMDDVVSSDSFQQDYVGFRKHPSGILGYTGKASSIEIATADEHRSLASGKTERTPVPANGNLKRLAVHSLTAGYGRHLVIKRASFEVEQGETVCILGPNGCGKSTLLRALSGLISASEGTILLDGQDISDMPAHERVRSGLRSLPQEQRLFESLSARENWLLSVSAINKPISSDSTSSPSRNLNEADLDAVNQFNLKLEEAGTRPSVTLSGGEQARIALQQLTYGPAAVLLIDEPTSGIDGVAQLQLARLIQAWNRSGISVVLVEHDIEFASSVAMRYLVIKNGQIKDRGLFQGEWRGRLISALEIH